MEAVVKEEEQLVVGHFEEEELASRCRFSSTTTVTDTLTKLQ